jgi:MarR family transcriptional regulator, organic hydroperoxide resistance regulator
MSGETLRFMQRMWDRAHAVDVRSKRMARSLGVTGPQRLVIRGLGRSPASTASGISSTLGMHPSTLTGILSRLERQGLIERKSDDVDRRRMRFRRTRKGSRSIVSARKLSRQPCGGHSRVVARSRFGVRWRC